MNKKIFSFAMMALLAFCSATPLAAQESADFAAETAEEASAYQGLDFEVPALEPKHKAVCDDYMSNMFTDPEKANRSLQRLLRSIQRKPEALVAVGHYFVTNSTFKFSKNKVLQNLIYQKLIAMQYLIFNTFY